ncbi:MAG: hypothetical protein SXA11_11770, partial [Cyanobacteriota bacterium]|nr:hypothetical protein [Cyanobacteriota bacterium]
MLGSAVASPNLHFFRKQARRLFYGETETGETPVLRGNRRDACSTGKQARRLFYGETKIWVPFSASKLSPASAPLWNAAKITSQV